MVVVIVIDYDFLIMLFVTNIRDFHRSNHCAHANILIPASRSRSRSDNRTAEDADRSEETKTGTSARDPGNWDGLGGSFVLQSSLSQLCGT